MARTLESILTQPQATIAVIGPRKNRRTLKTLSKMGGALMVGVVLGQGVAYVGNKGIFDEIHAVQNSVGVHQPVATEVQWLDLPTTAFFEVAKEQGGSYSFVRLMAAFDQADVSAHDAKIIAEQFRHLTPVMLKGDDPILAAMYQKEASDAIRFLSTTMKQYEQPLQAMVGQRIELKHDINVVRERYMDVIRLWYTDQFYPEQDNRISWDEVHDHFKKAVDETGLRAVRLNTESLRKDRLLELSSSLIASNQELQHITGWDQQVLGLGGRVVLNLFNPLDKYQAHATARMYENGVLEIHTKPDNMAHEWFHGLDYVLAPYTLQRSYNGTLTQQMQPLRLVVNAHIWNNVLDLRDAITTNTPNWQQHIHHHIENEAGIQRGKDSVARNAERYWTSSTEQLAYAFQSYVNQHPNIEVLRNHKEQQAPHLGPSDAEIKATRHQWVAFFDNLSPLKLNESPTHISTKNLVGSAAPHKTTQNMNINLDL